ncbi:MAG: CehA/McbA family metallohydrolase [Chloroflexi bacterium]|nr:CehA/McbA family metallohydrolase [Chloroflexota bacterium]
MPSYEYAGNLHVHTPYSDGAAYHTAIAEAARLVGLDFVVFTDHNLWLDGIDGYYGNDKQGYVLLLTGEEVHDRTRLPQCNHLLVYGAQQELAPYAYDLAALVRAAHDANALSFIAHPDDRAVAWQREPAIPWLDRYVSGFTGLEVWNYMSRFKDHLPSRSVALRHVFRPDDVIVGPSPRTLALWDELLSMGQRVVGIGGADAHGTTYTFGPVSHTIFPYDFLFSCVNTHILTKFPLRGDLQRDRALLYDALREGRAFIGYDVPGPTRGFRFSAQGQNTSAIMGEGIRLGHGITLQVLAPARARIKIICHGEVVAEDRNVENLTHVVSHEGAYRVEVWQSYHGIERAWILSNPIYVEPNPSRLRP